MEATYQYTLLNKLKFIVSFISAKFQILRWVKKGKASIILIEILWLLRPIFRYSPFVDLPFISSFYITQDGSFYIYKELMSGVIVSPTFEKDDKDYFLYLMGKSIRKKKQVVFIDVGAHFGTYTIAVGKKFSRYKNLYIYSFEPNATNFHHDNYTLLKKNIAVNKLTNVKLFQIGLGDKDAKTKNKLGFIIQRLDSLTQLNKLNSCDELFIKIDIEGYETEVLEGAQEVLKKQKNVTLIVEDCVNTKIINYLENNNFNFLKKLTPYNSFWQKKV